MINVNIEDLKFVFSNLNLNVNFSKQPLSEMINEGENFNYKALNVINQFYVDIDGDNYIRFTFDHKGEKYTWYIDTPEYFKHMRRFKLEKLK